MTLGIHDIGFRELASLQSTKDVDAKTEYNSNAALKV